MRVLYEGIAPLFLCDTLIKKDCMIRLVDYGTTIRLEYFNDVWRLGNNFYHTEAPYKVIKLLCGVLSELQD
jgi:hypothetical protein